MLFLKCILLLVLIQECSAYSLYKTVDSSNFMSFFNFDTNDYNHGNVQYVTSTEAKQLGILRFNDNQIYLGTDTKSWGRRKSIKVLSKEEFNDGLFIMQLKHMPAGCGTWPAWWLTGPNWPNAGEIDIIEGVNKMKQDATTLHTSNGCYASGEMTGKRSATNCYAFASNNAGCGTLDPDTASFGSAFNAQNGGAFALLWDQSGIKAWSWRAGRLPPDILAQKPNPANWGLPYAAFDFGSNCPSSHFHDHTMVINTNFCGDWAGNVFAHDCPGKGSCTSYTNNPSSGAEAYWLIDYIDIYSVGNNNYKKTQGYCRGGPLWNTGILWDCSPGYMDSQSCASVCDRTAGCGGYDRPDTNGSGECCLFRPGSTGNGDSGRVCYVKATTNTFRNRTVELTAEQASLKTNTSRIIL